MNSVETIGQQWMRLPDHIECGLEKYVIVQAGQMRLILCRVERVSQSYGFFGPIVGSTRVVPFLADEMQTYEFSTQRL